MPLINAEETLTSKKLKAQAPLDSKAVIDTIANRDLIPDIERYHGMRVFVEEDSTAWILLNAADLTNTGWTSISSGGLFVDDLLVSLSGGKTFGKYLDGETIPAVGKSANEVIKSAIFEAINPTATLNSSGDDVDFGQAAKVVNLNFSFTILTPGAAVLTTVLETRRGGAGSWVDIPILTTDTSAIVAIDDSGNRFDTGVLNYRYIVTDDGGGTITTTYNVTPQAYQAPTLALTLGGVINTPETQSNREKGNVTGGIASGSLNSNRPLVDITSWSLQRNVNGGAFTEIATDTGLSDLSIAIPATADNAAPTSANAMIYKLTYIDEFTGGGGGDKSIAYKYFSFYGYNVSPVLNEAQIQALAAKAFLSGKALADNFTAATLEYVYYSYPASYGAITQIILDGVTPILGAFTELATVNVTNSYGEVLTYRVLKSNGQGAFTANNVAFS